MVLCLDLSAPSDMWVVAETLLNQINGRVEQCLTEAARSDDSVWSKVSDRIQQQYGEAHDVSPQVSLSFYHHEIYNYTQRATCIT